jgi:hypothetical protein
LQWSTTVTLCNNAATPRGVLIGPNLGLVGHDLGLTGRVVASEAVVLSGGGQIPSLWLQRGLCGASPPCPSFAVCFGLVLDLSSWMPEQRPWNMNRTCVSSMGSMAAVMILFFVHLDGRNIRRGSGVDEALARAFPRSCSRGWGFTNVGGPSNRASTWVFLGEAQCFDATDGDVSRCYNPLEGVIVVTSATSRSPREYP